MSRTNDERLEALTAAVAVQLGWRWWAYRSARQVVLCPEGYAPLGADPAASPDERPGYTRVIYLDDATGRYGRVPHYAASETAARSLLSVVKNRGKEADFVRNLTAEVVGATNAEPLGCDEIITLLSATPEQWCGAFLRTFGADVPREECAP
jgi:hypothetical protein